ncbi:MAG: hypothetical protein PSX71_12490 [bacterium]|nr:hypothetical protein [bacterium]
MVKLEKHLFRRIKQSRSISGFVFIFNGLDGEELSSFARESSGFLPVHHHRGCRSRVDGAWRLLKALGPRLRGDDRSSGGRALAFDGLFDAADGVFQDFG